MGRVIAAAALIFGLGAETAVYAAGDLLSIRGKHRIENPTEERLPYGNAYRPVVSQKNLLGISRKAPGALPDQALAESQTINIRVCAIRVQFRYEDTDDANTTGRGHFDMRSPAEFISQEKHEIDMAPHDRTYFETHLRALNEYWGVVSKGRIALTYDVFPSVADSVYTLGETMAHYGAQSPLAGLSEYFKDAFELADSDPEIHFADYDVFVTFHAGADQQTDIGYPRTAYDLYTGFIFLNPSEAPVVDEGTAQIFEGLMMPETACQDNQVIALNGVFAHEFGHQLGTVDLYDTRTWMTQVGDFSLYDNQGRGTSAEIYFPEANTVRFVVDALPVFPDAWTRAYLGFVEVHEVTSANDFEVWAAELLTDHPQVVKVPISDHEYYLIENRQTDSDGDDSSNVRVDSLTGVVLGPAPADPDDPRRLTRDYDYFVPGSGLLIWHIDETRAYLDYNQNGAPNFLDNSLQWYNYYPCLIPNDLGLCIDSIEWENRRFVSIVEADGVIDFGGNYRTRYGSPEDLFFAGNNDALTPTTNPSTKSNSGAYTGINIFDISSIDTVMSFDVKLESNLQGFPKFANRSQFPPVFYGILGFNGVDGIFLAGKRHIVAMLSDGSPLNAIPVGDVILDSSYVFYGDTLQGGGYVVDTLRAIASVGPNETITTKPLVCDLNGNGWIDIAVGTDSGSVYAWELRDSDSDDKIDQIFSVDLPSGVCAGPVAIGSDFQMNALLCATDSGWLFSIFDHGFLDAESLFVGKVVDFAVDYDDSAVYYVAGPSAERATTILGKYPGSTIHDLGNLDVVSFTAADLDSSNGTDFAMLTSDGYLVILLSSSASGDQFEMNSIKAEDSLAGGVVTAQLDPTLPFYQIMFAGINRLHVHNYNGMVFENFPKELDFHRSSGMIRSTPIVADVSGDDQPEILVGTNDGELFAVGIGGGAASDPYFAGSDRVIGAAVMPGTSANNYRGKLYALSADNRLYGLSVRSRSLDAAQSWPFAGRQPLEYNFRSTSPRLKDATASDGLIASFYNYPNPADEFTNIRYKLNSPDGHVKISIFDLSGRLVYEDNAQGGELASEYRWTLDGYPSGVYICRLEASAGGTSDVRTTRIAVVR